MLGADPGRADRAWRNRIGIVQSTGGFDLVRATPYTASMRGAQRAARPCRSARWNPAAAATNMRPVSTRFSIWIHPPEPFASPSTRAG